MDARSGWMSGPSRAATLDDEEAYGFRFGQLSLSDGVYSPSYPARLPYPTYQPQIYPPPSPFQHHQQTPFIPYQQWVTPPMTPMMQFDRTRQPSEEWQYQTPMYTPASYQVYTPFTPQYDPPVFRGSKFKEVERKAYHPQPPAKRSDWVMWVGNVPPNTSHEELWRYFNTTTPPGDEPWKGPSSIFLISRSSCAFVNLSSQADLDRAVAFFNGRPLRGWDARCPRMVCRVRRKDDDLRAGVGAQRGTGMHREWVKGQEPPEGEGRRRESIKAETHKSTNSYASTNSSFLVQHFPRRIFILKSASAAELEESVKTGTWRTQRHNEPVLDRAFRTAPEVFLIFGANKAGEFFGYARMVEAIDKTRPELPSASSSISNVPMASPSQLTPGDEDTPFVIPPFRHSHEHHSAAPHVSDLRPNTLDPKLLQQSNMAESIAAMRATERNAQLNVDGKQEPPPASKTPPIDADGVLRKDTIPKPEVEEGMGSEFRIEWLRVGSLPFGKTRHLRNPWNADREVKVSRDGTEVEPNVGTLLLAEWDK